MDLVLIAVILVVALALLFDFTNGFHDAANAVSTTIATKAMRPKPAVIYAATFNFLPALVGSTLVANTISKTVDVNALAAVPEGSVPLGVRVTWAALMAAITWNYFTWWFGIPSSSSHALIGGLVGAGLAAGGSEVINWDQVRKTAAAILASPAIAFTVALIAFQLVRLFQRLTKVDDDHTVFKWGQIVSAGAVSWGHGSNDAQKTMGVIAATLGAAGYISADAEGHYPVPTWVVFAAASMISFGTYWGGWAIIDTMGLKITRLSKASGLSANIGATIAIFGASSQGIPISTTHAAATSIMGAGVSSRRRVNWIVMRDMAFAWVVTMPITGVIGYLTYQVTTISRVVSWASVLSLTVALGLWAAWLMTRAENADDVSERVEDAQEDLLIPTGAGPHDHIPPTLHGPAGHGEPPPPHTLA
jgi:inorganic phosphate transporter, PiT family